MGSQVDLAILMVWDFVFPEDIHVSISSSCQTASRLSDAGANLPLIESDIVLDKQQDLIWQIRRPQRSSEVNVL